MPMFPTFPQPFPSALDQDGADPQLPSDSPLARLSRTILSGQLPEEMRPHVARVLQGIRQDIANEGNTSAYGGFNSPLASPGDYSQSPPVWGSLAPPSANDDVPMSRLRTAFGNPSAGGSPPGDWQSNTPSNSTGQATEGGADPNVDDLPITRVASTRPWPAPGFSPIPPVFVPGTPENREWTDQATRGVTGLIDYLHSLSRSLSRGSGRSRKRREEDCYERWQDEDRNCFRRTQDYAHRDFRDACRERARVRYQMCRDTGQYPEKPPEWGLDDEEVWLNLHR